MDDELKRRLWLMAAGLAGGFVTLTTSKQEMTMGQRVSYLLSALFTALFVVPYGCEYFNISSPSGLTFIGFVTGAFWQIIIVKGSDFIKNWKLPLKGASKDE